MPKVKYRELKESVNSEKLNALRFYESKYFGLFLNAYKFTNSSKQSSGIFAIVFKLTSASK